ncbi:hypothetical protein [Dyella sp. 2RAB6]|uniref:hypothetical protein n=1 Tax=Dyella sp. 2RAB6 TaxID=3232992 RepID=UPI003F8E5D91
MLASSGYGLWLLLGTTLALGLYPAGRGDALVPLTLGAVLVSLAPLAAALRLPLAPEWLGWRFGRGSRPTAKAMLALAAYLPMLGVAGLVRGDNLFWATRLAAAALAIGSLACLIDALSERAQEGRARIFARLVSASYAGGLWLWLCLAAQDGDEPLHSVSWIFALQSLALLVGLIAWWRDGGARTWPGRLLFLALVYLIPGLIVLAQRQEPHGLLLLLAAVSCMVGQSVEARLCGPQASHDGGTTRLI